MPFNADLLYQKYQGQTLSYDGIPANAGQCVQWAEYVLTDTQYGYGVYAFYGNAIDWWNNYGGSLLAFDKIIDGSIRKGDIVVFNQNVGSVYGHIDMALGDGTVDQFLGADSNWGGNKTVHQVNHVGRQYVIGSLRLKGGNMATPANLNQIRMFLYFIRGYNGHNGTPNALAGEADNIAQGWVGKDLGQALDSWYNDSGSVQFRESTLPAVYKAAETPAGVQPYNGPQLFTKG